MPIQPVSGEIKAQPLNNNFSYLESLALQANGGPIDEVTSVAALNTNYPNGANGVVLVNGVIYLWNGSSWFTNNSIYQTQGVGDKTIAQRKLAVPLLQTMTTSNLCTFDKLTWGRYVNYQNGNLIANEIYVTATISLSSINELKIVGTNEQGCFKDSSGVYISGYVSVATMPAAIPANAAVLVQTIRLAEVDNTYIGSKGGLNEPPAVIAPQGIGEQSINMTKHEQAVFVSQDANFFDLNDVETGRYVNYLTGTTVAGANFSASNFIPIDPRIRWEIVGTEEQWALYDSYGQYISGSSKASNLKETHLNANVRRLKITVRNSELGAVIVRPVQEIDSAWITQKSANKVADLIGVEAKNYVIVKKDGSADYSSLRDAISDTVSGTIIEFTETFAVEEEFTQSEISSSTFLGYELKDNKILDGKGVGVIQADLDSDIYSFDNIRQVSPISVTGNGKIRNMTLIGKNCRYACHPDFAGANDFIAENVIFIKENAGTDPQALGAGTKSGQNHRYKNCTFKTEWLQAVAVPASYHTNNGFSEPSIVLFEDCRYITQNDEQQQLRLGAMASNQKNNFEFIGNRLSKILVKEEQMNGSGIDMVLRGRGNRQLTVKVESQSGVEQPEFDFVEEVIIE